MPFGVIGSTSHFAETQMINFTNRLGQLTELWCQLHFCERGIVLSQPTNPSSRYDFVADIEGKLYKIQCKTAHPETNDRISIKVQSKNWNSGESHNYIGEIDFFYTYWNGIGYLLPIETCTETNRQKFIRLGNSEQYHSNNTNALYGKEYQIDEVLSRLGINYEIINIENSDRRMACKQASKKKNKCIDCGKIIDLKSTRCWECHKKTLKSKDMPTREELKELIRTLPFTKIGEKYGKTDNAIRKWCDKYSLPRKKSDIIKISDNDWINI